MRMENAGFFGRGENWGLRDCSVGEKVDGGMDR